MPNYSEHPTLTQSRVMVIGDSGSGKTHQIGLMANAGYNVHVADFDNGLHNLRPLLTKEGASRLQYETFTDTLKDISAYNRFLKVLQNWPGKGALETWGPSDLLAIDTGTFMADAILRRELANSGKKMTDRPTQNDWGNAVREFELLLTLLSSPEIKASILMNMHIRRMEDEATGMTREFPSVIGKVLPSKVGRYFNAVILVETARVAGADKRIFRTTSTSRLALKHPMPGVVQDTMDADLPTFFKLLAPGK